MHYKILLASRNASIAIELKQILKQLGHDVTYVMDSPSMLAAMPSSIFNFFFFTPDILEQEITDVFAELNRSNPYTVSLALMEAEDFSENLEPLRSKIADFITKPFDTEIISSRMEFLIERQRRRKKYRVLAIGAHPDDVEIGCGGVLLKHHHKGDDISILTLSDGNIGGEPSARVKESEAAAASLNANLFWGGLPDTRISDGGETIIQIEKVIREIEPDIIYTHSNNDAHQDHRNAHLASMVAARNVQNVYCYQSPSCTTGFTPSRFENVANFMSKKQTLISYYASQLVQQRSYLTPEMIMSTAVYWGRFAGYGLVEPFEVIRSFS